MNKSNSNKKLKPYETEEGCLSLTGVRKTIRYKVIEVEYLDENGQIVYLEGETKVFDIYC